MNVLPDAEAVVYGWLTTHASVTALTTAISRRVPANPTWPALTYKRVGGVPVERRWIDQARIQIAAWGTPITGEAEASLLARTTRAAMHDLEGQLVADAWVAAVDDDTALTWLPDDSRDPTIPRFTFGVLVTLHP